jgi:hypothetical protein
VNKFFPATIDPGPEGDKSAASGVFVGKSSKVYSLNIIANNHASEEALSGNLAFTDATKNPEAFTVRVLYQPASISG